MSGCCEVWDRWEGSVDKPALWLHHLAHGRVPFTEAWLSEVTGLERAATVDLCRAAHEAGWLASTAFGGAAGEAPAGRGRTWVGALRRRPQARRAISNNTGTGLLGL